MKLLIMIKTQNSMISMIKTQNSNFQTTMKSEIVITMELSSNRDWQGKYNIVLYMLELLSVLARVLILRLCKVIEAFDAKYLIKIYHHKNEYMAWLSTHNVRIKNFPFCKALIICSYSDTTVFLSRFFTLSDTEPIWLLSVRVWLK